MTACNARRLYIGEVSLEAHGSEYNGQSRASSYRHSPRPTQTLGFPVVPTFVLVLISVLSLNMNRSNGLACLPGQSSPGSWVPTQVEQGIQGSIL